jgi:hypothetical protein
MLASPAADHPIWLLLAAGIFGMMLGVGLVIGAFAIRMIRKYVQLNGNGKHDD